MFRRVVCLLVKDDVFFFYLQSKSIHDRYISLLQFQQQSLSWFDFDLDFQLPFLFRVINKNSRRYCVLQEISIFLLSTQLNQSNMFLFEINYWKSIGFFVFVVCERNVNKYVLNLNVFLYLCFVINKTEKSILSNSFMMCK